MDRLRQDLRFALRQVGRAPLLSLVAVLVLTLGIGTNAVVFAVLDGIFFRPPPGVGDVSGLVEIWSMPTGPRRGPPGLTYPEFLAYRDQPSIFDEVAVYDRRRVALRTGEGRETVLAELASSGYFAVLDVPMELGRGFAPGNDRTAVAGPAPAIVGYGYWRRALDASTDALGRILDVNGRTYSVVGVAPRGFYGAGGEDDPVALWLPAVDHPLLFPEEENLVRGDRRAFRAVARLGDSASTARAEQVTQAVWRAIAESTPDLAPDDRRRIRVTPYRGLGSRRIQDAFAFVGLVGGLLAAIILLIACTNASGLLLARALGRRREIGIRLALGAGRTRIVRQLLTESALLAAVAGLAGLVLTFAVLDGLERTLFTFPVDLEPSLAVLVLTLCVTAGTTLAFGIVPALHATRAAVFEAMKDRVAGVDLRSAKIRNGFTVAQLALSLPLLTAAGLLASQLLDAIAGDYGFEDPRSVVAVRVDYNQAGYGADEIGRLLTRIRDRVQALPDVSGAAFTGTAPLAGPPSSAFVRPASSDGGASVAERGRPIHFAAVDPEYLRTMGIPILRGRDIRPSDAAGAEPVAVIDRDVAERRWPGEDPLGRALVAELLGSGEEMRLTVVGVAGRVRMWPGPDMRSPVVYASRQQVPDTTSMTLVVRTGEATGGVAAATRAEILEVDRDLVVDIRPLAEQLREGRTELSHASAGAAMCGFIALLLACVGLYGMIATGVSERTREIGVRIALGGDRPRIIGHFVRRGLTSALSALALGLPLSWMTVALVGTSVVGVTALEVEVGLALGGVALLMMAVAVVSSWLPARRSASVDPVLALRSE